MNKAAARQTYGRNLAINFVQNSVLISKGIGTNYTFFIFEFQTIRNPI